MAARSSWSPTTSNTSINATAFWCSSPAAGWRSTDRPPKGLRYFGKERWVEVYRAFRAEPERDWAGDFQRSSCYRQYVASGLTSQTPESARGACKPPPAPRSRLAQLTILCRRYAALIAADRSFLIWLAALPIVSGP